MFKKAMAVIDSLLGTGAEMQPADHETLLKSLKEDLGSASTIIAEMKKSVPAQGTEEIALMLKSIMTEQNDELVKASDAYADLQKSVEDGDNVILEEMGTLKKALASVLVLCAEQGKVIAELSKSVQEAQPADSGVAAIQEQLADMKKSIDTMAGLPTPPNKAQIGTGSQETETPMTKSTAEINALLLKAVQEKTVEGRWLSAFGTHKNPDLLPDNVKKAIGLDTE